MSNCLEVFPNTKHKVSIINCLLGEIENDLRLLARSPSKEMAVR
jgi:hypothetical protein